MYDAMAVTVTCSQRWRHHFSYRTCIAMVTTYVASSVDVPEYTNPFIPCSMYYNVVWVETLKVSELMQRKNVVRPNGPPMLVKTSICTGHALYFIKPYGFLRDAEPLVFLQRATFRWDVGCSSSKDPHFSVNCYSNQIPKETGTLVEHVWVYII